MIHYDTQVLIVATSTFQFKTLFQQYNIWTEVELITVDPTYNGTKTWF